MGRWPKRVCVVCGVVLLSGCGGNGGADPTIAVTSPNGGETWTAGSPGTVAWSTTGTVGDVKFELSVNGGSTWTPLVGSTANDGAESIIVPDVSSTHCRVRVSECDGDPSDSCDADFTITSGTAATITVSIPDGGESWTIGSYPTVTWSMTGTVAYVRIELSIDGGVSWRTLSACTENDGSAGVMVPYTPSDQCLVRISDEADGDPSDVSDACFSIDSSGRVWYVDIDALGPTHDGNSWATAFLHPQDAVDAAAGGDEVWVAEGTYNRRDSGDTVLLTMKNMVSVVGGFAGTEVSRGDRDPWVHVATLDGEDLCYHVVVSAWNALFDGFTVTAGNGTGSYPDYLGAGMYNSNVSRLTVANCTFVNNAAGSGAGMHNSDSSPMLVNCTFSGNAASSGGGGMSNITNSAPTITNCIFSGNSGGMGGGGMANNYSSPTLASCAFFNNTSNNRSGGVSNFACAPAFTNCTFSGNTANSYGGGMSNTASSPENVSSPTLTNCVFWGNSAPTGPQIYTDSTSSCTVTYSDVQGGYAGTGNINADPLFVDAGSGDLRLQAGSPCVDAADGDAGPATDIEGNARYDDPATTDTGTGSITYADMGAYEYAP